MLGKPSLKRQITTPKFNLFLAVGFPTHPTYSYLEELVFKKKKEKVWTKNNNQLFFEVASHSLLKFFVFSPVLSLRHLAPPTRPPPYLQTRRCFSLWMER